MDFYILLAFLLVVILIFIIDITCYHYAKHRLKTKKNKRILKIDKNNEIKRVVNKNCTCYYFDN